MIAIFPCRRVAPILVSLGLLTSCAPSVLDPAGPVAAGEKLILLNSLAIMLAIVVPTMIATVVFAWWFRAGNTRATYRPDWSYSGKIELLVWSIPLLVIIFLGGIGWIGSHTLDPSRPLDAKRPPLIVQVIALDWKWVFIYPQQRVATINELVLPVGRPVEFRITSGTVMNSFFIPQLGSQIYAMAGMKATLHLQADRPGEYLGMSAHYSGAGFPEMRFAVDAVAPQQFGAWVEKAHAQEGPVLDMRNYLKLAATANTMKPLVFQGVQPGLFDAAVAQAGAPVAKIARDGRER